MLTVRFVSQTDVRVRHTIHSEHTVEPGHLMSLYLGELFDVIDCVVRV